MPVSKEKARLADRKRSKHFVRSGSQAQRWNLPQAGMLMKDEWGVWRNEEDDGCVLLYVTLERGLALDLMELLNDAFRCGVRVTERRPGALSKHEA